MIDYETWRPFIQSLAYCPRFVTVSGAHLYGFPSPDSDIDLRGCHQLPLSDIVGLRQPNLTFQLETICHGTEVDLVSHDIGKYFGLLVKNNGYVLEQIFSPHVIQGAEFLDRLRPLAAECITRNHYHHYRGFYGTQRKLIEKQKRKTAKAVLYAYRVLVTGIHLLQSGQVEANLLTLNEQFKLDGLVDLVASKREEIIAPPDLDWEFHGRKLDDLATELDDTFNRSQLQETPDRDAIHDFLVELRMSDSPKM